ncbi:MAG: HAD family phosphatase [Erysipelotrichaceae bacterium]|nr:HAD family phosphatase [Erysipelotrichaceae bacterium]
MKKFVFIDIDGTLYDNRNHCVPESAIKALTLAQENGHELFICTGRVKEMVENKYHLLPVSGFVYGCGSHIEINGHIVYEAHFPRKEMDDLISYFRKHGIEFTLEGREVSYFSEGAMDLYMSYFCKSGSEMEQKFKAGKAMRSFSEIDEAGYSQILKVAFQAKEDELMRPILDALPESLTYFTYSDSFSGDVEGEILVKGADKADSIERVVNYFHGNMEETIALGDSDNDISMIKKAHLGVAMGNACDNLKQEAEYITSHVSEDGLYNAFQYLKLI